MQGRIQRGKWFWGQRPPSMENFLQFAMVFWEKIPIPLQKFEHPYKNLWCVDGLRDESSFSWTTLPRNPTVIKIYTPPPKHLVWLPRSSCLFPMGKCDRNSSAPFEKFLVMPLSTQHSSVISGPFSIILNHKMVIYGCSTHDHYNTILYTSVFYFKTLQFQNFYFTFPFPIIIKIYTSKFTIIINSLKPLFTNEKAEFASNNQDYNMQIIFLCYS